MDNAPLRMQQLEVGEAPRASRGESFATGLPHDYQRGDSGTSFLSQNHKRGAIAAVCLLLVLCFCIRTSLFLIAAVCVVAQVAGIYMGLWILSLGEGRRSMVNIASAIREGSEAYVKTMFSSISMLILPFSVVILILHWKQDGFKRSIMVTVSFLLGAFCSSLSGIIGMWSSTRANARVAQTACEGTFRDTIVVALRSGAVAGIWVVSLAVFGISVLFALASLFERTTPNKVPHLLVGFGFGASFVAMFAQLGGGIFTKAADVGADLCGKVELDIPEDDPRNPAVIADLVGDNVGDCCARGADLFESLSAEIIAAMILGGELTKDWKIDGEPDVDAQYKFMLFPLVVHVADLIVSIIGVMSVQGGASRGSSNIPEDPLALLKKGYTIAVGLALLFFGIATRVFLYKEDKPVAWSHFAFCGVVGMATGYLVVLITQYYTDFKHKPVRDIARASEGGHGTNVIAGLAVGLESTFMPVAVVCGAILCSYYLGRSSDLSPSDPSAAGLFGTAVATMGMLSNLTFVLAMDVFGPIADNAAGIVEMSPDCPEGARDVMDRLDAVGNTTKAFTKGYAVGSAGLACFLLFRAFLDLVNDLGHKSFQVDAVQPEMFVAGILGGTTVFLFAALAMHAVGVTAQEVVNEVRRQFREVQGIATGATKPEYGVCVEIVSVAAIRCMRAPGLLVVIMPVLVGGGFRLVGSWVGDELLGAKAMTSYLVSSSMIAMLMALFLNNGGGAWDNAKKFIESGQHGGKGSDAHKASVTGDTVGDPCKDTAGPSLHVLMKLTATVTMVAGPVVAMPYSEE